MKVITLVLNEESEPHFRAEDHPDVEKLFEIATSKMQGAKTQGEEFTRGAINFWGTEIVAAVNTGEHKDVTKAIYGLLLTVLVYENLFLGATLDSLRSTDWQFTITVDGVVVQTRIPR